MPYKTPKRFVLAREEPTPEKPEKYYVITHGAEQAWKATVHREICPMLPRFKHAKVRDRNPLDDDRWNHYQKCQRCWPAPASAK